MFEVVTLLLVALGSFLAFGPYQDDRTWNLVRNSCDVRYIRLPDQEPSHFGLYAITDRAYPKAEAPVLVFVPGHGGSWKQGKNLNSYLSDDPVHFYVLDFHASASALHWSVLKSQASYTAAALDRLKQLHQGPQLVLGHSMGGLVALEALKSRTVDVLLLVSAPLEFHPLLLDPRFQMKADASARIYSVSGGATDPLVPLHCSRAEHFLPLPAAGDVYSSFSHVNLLFSRHSLHFFARLLRGQEVTSSWRQLLGTPLEAWGEQRAPVALKDLPELLPRTGPVFSFLLMEEPKPLNRAPQRTSRGETFNAADRLNCSDAQVLWQDEERWLPVPFMEMQFPTKACLFQLRSPAPAVKIRVATQKRSGWAHWHRDPLQDFLACHGLWPLLPLRCQLAAGRAVVTRLVLPMDLPWDLRIAEVASAASSPLLLAAVAPQAEDLRIAALPLVPGSTRSWAAESNPEIFAPRFVEDGSNASIFVMGHPDVEIILEVRFNLWSWMADFMRRESFGSWLGALGALAAADLDSRPGRRCWVWVLAWILLTCLVDAMWPVNVHHLLDQLMGLGLAMLSRRVVRLLGSPQRGRPRLALLVFLSLLLLASLQPAGCFLVLAIAAVRCASQEAPMLGLSSLLLGPYLLCYLPSIVFAVWLLLGQHREASDADLQSKLDLDLGSSQHRPSLWADSWLLETREGLLPGLRPALGLLAPSVALCCSLASEGVAMRSRPGAMLLLLLSCGSTQPGGLWWACQPLLAAHAAFSVAHLASKEVPRKNA